MSTPAPETITRYNLVLTLIKQYNGQNPIILERDGKSVYDFKNDKIKFTCCSIYEHKHCMSPLQILQLKYIYGANPCPICSNLGYNNIKKPKDDILTEDGSDMDRRKKFLYSDDPSENANREAELQNEIDKFNKKLNPTKKNGPQRTVQSNEIGPELNQNDDIIAESINIDDYMKENPDFVDTVSDKVTDVNDIQIKEDEPIIESIDYNEYIKSNPEFANESKIDDFDFEKHNEFNQENFLDNLFENGQEEGMQKIFVDNNGKIVDSDHINDNHSQSESTIKKYKPQHSDNFIKPKEQINIQEMEEPLENISDEIEEYDSSNDKTEELNSKDTNILLNEYEKEDFNPDSLNTNIVEDDDDEEEEFKIGKYV